MSINYAPRKAFSAAMRKFRQQRGISQEKLALEIEMDRSYVSALERGLHSPTLDTMCRLCEILNIRFTHLARDIEAACHSASKSRTARQKKTRL